MITRILALTTAATLLAGCAATSHQAGHAHGHTPSHAQGHGQSQGNPATINVDRGVFPVSADTTLVAVVTPVGDSGVTGTFHFYPADTGVRVVATVTGLTPNAKHGCHIHVFGDETDRAKAASAGVHFNPFNHEHNLPPAEHRHAGAFPNLEADATGAATLDFTDETISITGDLTAIIGRSVIIHEGEDVGAQPWGGAGGRIGLGVIGVAHPGHTPDAPAK